MACAQAVKLLPCAALGLLYQSLWSGSSRK